MSTTEKLLTSFITFVYLGTVAAFIVAVAIGGRAAFIFVIIGFYVAVGFATFRGAYLLWKYQPAENQQMIPRWRVRVRRGFVALLYAFLGYSHAAAAIAA